MSSTMLTGHNSVTVSKGSFREYDTLRLFCNHLAFQMPLGLTCLCACLKQRNSHWRVQSFNGHSQSIKNNGPGSAFPGHSQSIKVCDLSILHCMIQNMGTSSKDRGQSEFLREASSLIS